MEIIIKDMQAVENMEKKIKNNESEQQKKFPEGAEEQKEVKIQHDTEKQQAFIKAADW